MRSGGPIVVREYEARDRDAVKRIAGSSDVNPLRDAIYVAEIAGEVVGVLAQRMIPLAHTLEIQAEMTAARVADALVQYATGFMRASGCKEVLFLVDPGNARMARFIQSRGAQREEIADVYTMEVK